MVDCNRISEVASQRSVVGRSVEDRLLGLWSVVSDGQGGGGPVGQSLVGGQ